LTDGAPGSPTVFMDPGHGGHPSVTAILNLSESRKSKLQEHIAIVRDHV